MARGGDVPDGLEILDADGAFVAAEPEAPVDRPRRTPGRSVAAVLGAVAIALIAVVGYAWWTDDPETGLVEPVPLVQTDAIRFADATDAEFPLFGRDWDHELIYESGNRIRAIDLNTGAERGLALGPGIGQTYGLEIIDDTIVLETWDGIFRVDSGSLVRRSDGRPGRLMLGSYVYDDVPFGSSLTFTHVLSGEEVVIDSSLRWVGVGDDILFERGQWILAARPGREPQRWARGELLAQGRTNVIWRRCDDPNACEYWVGTGAEPEARSLDPAVAESAVVVGWANNGAASGFLNSFDTVSPSGRYAITIGSSGGATFDRVVDLDTGTFVLIDDSFPPHFTPDESALFSADRNSIVFVDLATGEAVRIAAEVPNRFTMGLRRTD